jgi:uncharacterized membrane protein
MTLSEPPSDRPVVDDRSQAAIVYVLYLIALGTAFTALIDFVLAWMARAHADEMARSHFTFQIRTVLIGLGYVVLGAILTVFYVGWLILAWWYLWSLIRSVKGLLTLNMQSNDLLWREGFSEWRPATTSVPKSESAPPRASLANQPIRVRQVQRVIERPTATMPSGLTWTRALIALTCAAAVGAIAGYAFRYSVMRVEPVQRTGASASSPAAPT